MVRYRDSHGRFTSRPRDSAGRFRSESWYNRSQAQRRRYAEAAASERVRGESEAAAEYSRRRAAEIAAEYESAARRFDLPPGPDLTQRQDAWGVMELGRIPGETDANISVHVELNGTSIYDYEGTAGEFAPAELKQALDEWAEEDLEDSAHYWRAPGLRMWQVDKWFRPGTLTAEKVEVKALPAADSLIQEAISGQTVLTGYAESPVAVSLGEWSDEGDALPE